MTPADANTAPGLQPGDVLLDRFVVERLSNSGGMGAIYRARDRVTTLPVALKVVRSDRSDHVRFAREADVLAQVAHPAIVRYVAHGECADGQLFLAMEWLDGEDLGQRLKRTRLSDSETLALARSVASALAAAHTAGLVHRDVKPSNIFLVDGDPRTTKLIDFGIARPIAFPLFTITGALIGTPHYMSPEQANGDKALDSRSDVYSLGCVLFECFTGHRLRARSEMYAVIARAILEDAPRISTLRPDIDRNVELVVARMLARERAARPLDGRAVELELAAIVGGTPLAGAALDTIAGGEQRLRTLVAVHVCDAAVEKAVDSTVTVNVLRTSLEPVADAMGARVEMFGPSMLIASIPPATLPREEAARAARLALRIRELAPDARIAIAMARGPAVTHASGDIVARAMTLIDGGATATMIRVDALTADLLDDRFVVRREHDAAVLIGEGVGRAAERRLLGRLTPCVGREQELARLEGMLAECLTEATAKSALVVGDAGTGKSRVCDEFVGRVSRRYERLRIIRAYGHLERAGSPFAMVAEIVRQLVGVTNVSDARADLLAWAERECEPASARRTAALLGEIAGAPFASDRDDPLHVARLDAQLMSDLLREAWKYLAVRELATSEVLVVLEDVHWGDLPSTKLIEIALRALADCPFMVVATARGEVRSASSALWPHDEIMLGPLGTRAAERLVRAALGDDISPPLVARIVDYGAGHPLYLEELIRTSIRGGDALPLSVVAAVQARLDNTGEDGKQLLRAASMYGERFWEAGVEAIVANTVATSEVLTALVAHEIIVASARSSLPGQGEYRFRHAMFREAAYALWLDDDRRTAHRLAARWLESAGERDALTLAEHYRLGDLPDQASVSYRRAAEQAMAGGDLRAAISLSSHAADCLPTDAVELAGIRLIQAEAHFYLGEVAAAEQRAHEALLGLAPGGEIWFRALALTLSSAGQQGGNDRVQALLVQALAAPVDANAVSRAAETLARGVSQLSVANAPALLAQCQHEIARLAVRDSLDAIARAWIARGNSAVAFVESDFDGMLRGIHDAMAAHDSCGDVRGGSFMFIALANYHLAVGEYAAAHEAARRATAGAERVGAAYMLVWSRLVTGKVMACRGDLRRARAELDVVIASAAGSPRLVASARNYLAYAALESGAPEIALVEARAAIGLAVPPSVRASSLALLARALVRLGETTAALVAARDANDLAASLPNVEEFDAVVRLALAEVLDRAGYHEEAREVIARARDRLLQRAARIDDPVRRDSFLTQRAENATTLRLATALAQSSGK